MDIIDELAAEIRFRAFNSQNTLAGLLGRAASEIERLREEVHFRVGKNAPDTSKAVSTKIKDGSLQWAMLDIFKRDNELGFVGWTDDELERILQRTHQSVSASRNTLMRKGYIEDSGARRKTRSGNAAIVWRLK